MNHDTVNNLVLMKRKYYFVLYINHKYDVYNLNTKFTSSSRNKCLNSKN